MRSHCFYQVVNNNSGRGLPNVRVEVFRSETGASFDATLYKNPTGSEAWSNPYVAPQGTVDFYLEEDAVVDLAISYRNMNQYVKAISVFDPFSSALPKNGVAGQVLTKITGGQEWRTLAGNATFTDTGQGIVILEL